MFACGGKATLPNNAKRRKLSRRDLIGQFNSIATRSMPRAHGVLAPVPELIKGKPKHCGADTTQEAYAAARASAASADR
jgi:hypothetical protein